jgi:precorrin-3B C17-methyltransferase
MQKRDHSPGQGKLFVVGIGPGNPLDRTIRAEKAIRSSEVVAGYDRYLEFIADLLEGKEIISSGMTRERERCRKAIEAALAGKRVSLVSSGDAGIYGMAGLALEMTGQMGVRLSLEIIPGVSAAQAGAAALGAPLMLDFACVSLSDLLVDWEEIEKRLRALAEADMVTVLYNPKSKRRTWQIGRVREIFLGTQDPRTPVGVIRNASLPDESVVLTDLENMDKALMDMRTLVIIGNSRTSVNDPWMVTSRGYFERK